MRATKPGFLIFDLPEGDEIDHAVSSEGKIVEAILDRRGLTKRIAYHRFTSSKNFLRENPIRLDVRFVHLAAHADEGGIGFLHGGMRWELFAKHLVQYLRPLGDKRRVMAFSCCHSLDGFEATKHIFKNHFTAAYLFNEKEVDFCDAITVWAMFYLKKTISNPHKKIVDPINEFFGKDVLKFRSY